MHALINDANLHYVESGKGSAPAVIFVHGFPFSHAMWDGQREAISGKFRAIAYDLRGHGMSDVGDGQYSIEGHVDDLFGLMDHLLLDQAIIVGLSMGGYITLRALERDQSRFRAAVLCDTRSETDTNEGRIRRAKTAASVKRIGSGAFAGEFVKGVFTEATAKNNPKAIEQIKTIISAIPPLSIAGSLLAMAGRTDTTASLASLSLPVLILVGEHDAVTPPDSAREMHSRIKKSVLHVVPGAAHLSNLENPSDFNSTLMKFLITLPA